MGLPALRETGNITISMIRDCSDEDEDEKDDDGDEDDDGDDDGDEWRQQLVE